MNQRHPPALAIEEILRAIEDIHHAGRRLQTELSPEALSQWAASLHRLENLLAKHRPLLERLPGEEILQGLAQRLEGQPSPPSSGASSPPQILIVEDEADTAEMFAEMLGLQGYQVEKIYRAEAAMEYLKQHHPDAIVLDIMMPLVSGLEVLRFVRQTPRLRDIPVVIVSAKAIPSEIQEVLNAGANAYLTKPITFAEFVDTLNALVKGQTP
ncbi:MAG TPA: response regulator [Anaerolineae bacterium]|nr:response regulator [Anaerolineae bacterium]HID83719.1 response regulator [Anaerolineales bacterium]HIQ08656.1 response regulator [Anaerolineaceae bacterium]